MLHRRSNLDRHANLHRRANLSRVFKLRRLLDRIPVRHELGQTTAEYALVILGAAAVATMLVTWATKSHAIEHLFDTVIDRVL